MKKLISSTLAVTMLVTPLVGSACFANEENKPKMSYAQNEKCSKKFKLKDFKLSNFKPKGENIPKIKKALAFAAAGTAAFAGVAGLWKFFKTCLPESFETQEDNESEKALEDFEEGENVETFIEGSNIAKGEAVEPGGFENGNKFTYYKDNETIGTLTTSNTKPVIVDSIINTGTKNTLWGSDLKCDAGPLPPKEMVLAVITGAIVSICGAFLYIFAHRSSKSFERLVNPASVNTVKSLGASKVKVIGKGIAIGKLSDGGLVMFDKKFTRKSLQGLLSGKKLESILNSLKSSFPNIDEGELKVMANFLYGIINRPDVKGVKNLGGRVSKILNNIFE